VLEAILGTSEVYTNRPEPGGALSKQARSFKSSLKSEDYVVKALPPVLKLRDLTAMFIVILFFITNVSSAVAGGPAGLTYWIVGALFFFIPCCLATAQLGVMFPHEGSLYSWTHKAFGRYGSFFVTFCAWIPCTILILATSDLAVSYIQGLNPNWLTEPWQQGMALLLIICFSAVVSLQRQKMIQNMVNLVVFLILTAVALVFISGLVWLAGGHKSATDFSQLSSWAITWSPWWNPFTGAGNFGLFGTITLGYLGVNLPLNMAGEIAPGNKRKAIIQHLIWGMVIVVTSYLLVTYAVLVVEGQNAAYALFAMVSTVDTALGRVAGNVTALCILATFVVATVVYNYIFARFLMVASIDQRIPKGVARLNRNRAPTGAILFQTIVSCTFVLLFFMVIPYLHVLGTKPADVANEVYFVVVGVATLMWAFATCFLFINILRLYAQDRETFRSHAIVSVPLQLLSAVIGLVVGFLAILDTLFNSYIPPLIPNGQWFLVVGLLTFILLILGALGSMLASGEAAWQSYEETTT